MAAPIDGTTLDLLREKGVVKASFNHDGTLASVEFGLGALSADQHEAPTADGEDEVPAEPIASRTSGRLVPRVSLDRT